MTTRSVLVFAILIITVGCDSAGDALVDSPPAPIPLFTSNVFDGRDSVATGIDGLVATQETFSIVTEFVRIESGSDDDDVSGFVPIRDPADLDPTTPLFESRELHLVTDPDGEEVTWGQFSAAEGAVTAKCTTSGTHIVTHVSGLLSKGLYTIWIDVLESGTTNRIGRFQYTETAEKGRSNVFRASGRGEGHLSGLASPQTVNSIPISACMLDDVRAGTYDFRIVGIYHIDGTPGVDQVDDSGTFVEQVSFLFEMPSSG